MFKATEVRDLYEVFRDCLIADCVRHSRQRINLFELIPKKDSIGRLHNLSMMRKMARRMSRDFPGGIRSDKVIVEFTPEFLAFAKTSFEKMDFTADKAIKTWRALSGLK